MEKNRIPLLDGWKFGLTGDKQAVRRTAPAVVLYLCMQKFFVKGVMIGSVKG